MTKTLNELLAGDRLPIAVSSLRTSANRFGEHDSMTVRRSDDELSESPALVGRLGDHLRTSRGDFAMILVKALYHQADEPRMVSGLAGSNLIRTLTQHELERVAREEAPTFGVHGVELKTKNLNIKPRRCF